MKIKDQYFLITGANRGIGLAVAKMAAQEGAHLILVSRSPMKNEKDQLLKWGAKSALFYEADLSTRNGVENLLQSLGDQRVDILFNNAGLLTGGLIEEQPIDEIYNMFQVNLNSLIHLTHSLLPGMIRRGHGKIINNSSVSAYMNFPCASTYAASKAAVVAFTNCIHLELKGTGVSTLCLITPGIKTRMFDEIDIKYSKNLEIPTDSITPDEYAQKIKFKILSDDEYLLPEGKTSLGLWLARNCSQIFKKSVLAKFKRS